MWRGGGGGGGGGGGADHTPCLHVDPTYSVGTSDKKLKGSSVLDFFQRKIGCDSQNESDTESTRAGDGNQNAVSAVQKLKGTMRAHLND